MTPHNPKAYEFLLKAVVTERSTTEVDGLQKLAREHYAGVMLEEPEAAVALRHNRLELQ